MQMTPARHAGRATPPPAANAIGLVAGVALVGCLPGAGPPIAPYTDDAGGPGSISLASDASLLADVDLGDPFAITGLDPSHGPWTGGTQTTIAGRGFSSSIEVWIGSTQLDPSSVVASNPTRVSVVTPPGTPGPADVRIRNAATAEERTLTAGFFYDSFVVSPTSGATTGGTRIALRGSGTQWTSASTVTVGGSPCVGLTLSDATDLSCLTPAGAPGVQDVTVANADGSLDQARDAFTYSNSPDGYRGGLYGGILSGSLEVLAFDSLTGAPLAGGKAIAGSNIATALIGTFDTAGLVQLTDPSLTGSVTVTIVAKCHQPITFVDVPVDTVTTYLDPVLDPSCGSGDPPSDGNYYFMQQGDIDGELVWQGGVEFVRSGWTNIPSPGPNEAQAAYVFVASGDPLAPFQLPPEFAATTPSSVGMTGYGYMLSAPPGNSAIYALAGIENRSVTPATFVPYAMGVVPGVLVQPGMTTSGVDIQMTTVLDQALITLPQPPAPMSLGPDRLISGMAVDVGLGQFAVLPQGTVTTFLPVSGAVSFIGVPALDGTLSGASYQLTAQAVTGANSSLPVSAVRGLNVNSTVDPVTIGGFLPIPSLIEPSTDPWSGTHVTVQASGPVDLLVVNVSSGNNLVTWQIVAPGTDLSFDLPDIATISGVTALVPGPLQTTYSIAHIDSFDYATVRYGQLTQGAWLAYAQNVATGLY